MAGWVDRWLRWGAYHRRQYELRLLDLSTPTGDKACDAEVGGYFVEVVMGILTLETRSPLRLWGLESVVHGLEACPQRGGFRC